MMAGFLKLFGGVWGKVLGLAALVLGALAIFARLQGRARQAGRDEVRAEVSQQTLKKVEKANAARTRVRDAAKNADRTDDDGDDQPNAVDDWVLDPWGDHR